MRASPEYMAAAVNGVVVLLLPSVFAAAFAIAASAGVGVSEYSVTVHPPGWSPSVSVIWATADFGIATLPAILPFALVAGWRTWVHARRWRDSGARGWQGVGEAGACGLVAATLVLLPGMLTRPIGVFPHNVLYLRTTLVIGLVIGLVVGLLLRAAAILVLKVIRSTTG
jgi:UPF0716 family protein affecting phage T7 exclusion